MSEQDAADLALEDYQLYNQDTAISEESQWIEDLIKIIIKCIEKKGLGIINLASDKICSFKNLAKLVINSSKSKSKLVKIK